MTTENYALHYFQIPLPVFEKMFHYVNIAPGEISGLGRVRQAGDRWDKVTVLEEVRIFRQECSPAHTELNDEELQRFLVGIIREGGNPADWCFWWHSHRDFTAYFSGTDTATIARLSKDSRLFSICMNRKGHMVGRYDENYQEPPSQYDRLNNAELDNAEGAFSEEKRGLTEYLRICVTVPLEGRNYDNARNEVREKVTSSRELYDNAGHYNQKIRRVRREHLRAAERHNQYRKTQGGILVPYWRGRDRQFRGGNAGQDGRSQD